MSSKMFIFVCLLAISYKATAYGIVEQTFYVSNEYGNDIQGCGATNQSACRSISHLLQNHEFPHLVNLTILIDGGTSEKRTYQNDNTISINPNIFSLAILSMPHRKKPTFKNSRNDPMPMFQFSKAPNIEMQNIDFYHLTPLTFSGDATRLNGNITIHNCLWMIKSINEDEDNFIGITSLPQRANLVIALKMDTVKIISVTNKVIPIIRDVRGYESAKWDIQITDSSFLVSGFHIAVNNYRGGSLNIKSTTFLGYVSAPYFFNITGFSEITMSDIVTKSKRPPFEPSANIGIAKIQHAGNIVIENNAFRNKLPLFHLYNVNSAKIRNCTFEKMKGAAILYFKDLNTLNFTNNSIADIQRESFLVASEVRNVHIEGINFVKTASPISITESTDVQILNTHFKYCNAGNGGGIYISNVGSINIRQCVFTENLALSQGGGIYSENTNVQIFDSIFDGNYATSCGTFRFSGNNNNVSLYNVNITSLQSNHLAPFTTIMENNGPNLFIDHSNINILESTGVIDVYTTSLNVYSNFSYFCPMNTNANFINKNFTLLSCKHCEKGKYSLQSGSVSFVDNVTAYHDIECKECPYGGDCPGSKNISARNNFWGYRHNSEIIFIQCPESYCCNNDSCPGINSCSKNRKGNICGVCKPFHYVNFFDNQCIHEKTCKHKILFWILYMLAIVVIFILVSFLPDIGRLIKRCFINGDQLNESIVENELLENELLVENELLAEKVPTSIILSGFLKILVNFYQMKLLIAVPHVATANSNFEVFGQILPSIFNLKITIQNFCTEFCPSKRLNDIDKLFIKNILPVVTLLAMALTLFYINKLIKKLSSCIGRCQNYEYERFEENENTEWMLFDVRCKVFVVSLMLIMYTNIITYIMEMTNFVELQTGKVLLISGETTYHNSKTYICIVFFILFALAFPPNTYLVTRWLQQRKIPNNWFLVCFAFPPLTIVFYIWNKNKPTHAQRNESETECLLRVLEEPFRRKRSTQITMLWDPVILFRRFLLALGNVYIKNYIIRLVAIIPIIFMMCVHHSKILPYKAKILNMVEIICFYILSFIAAINLFWAFFYVYGLEYQPPVSILGEVLKYTEFIMTLAPFFIMVVFCLHGFIRSCCKKIQRKCL